MKLLAVLIACTSAAIDYKTHKIPNKITVNAVFAGVILNFFLSGFDGLLQSFLGALIGFSFILLWILGALKAGDVKLYMALGALGGWRFGLNTMIYSLIIGGVAAFFVMVTQKNGRKSFRNLWNYGVNLFLTRKFHTYEGDESAYFCFGGCIAAGAFASLVFAGVV